MSNLFTYLNWRGDLTLREMPFQNADALILARLAYLMLEGIVPSQVSELIPMAQAMQAYLQTLEERRILQQDDPKLAAALMENRRFRRMALSGYQAHLDTAAEKQFAALTVTLEDGSLFLTYRGTDNTLVGWKEDLNMSFLDKTPSQLEAAAYLQNAAEQTHRLLRAGGHSKGGNLAVFAAAFSPPAIQQQVVTVYNFDGPGFLPSVHRSAGYQAIESRVQTYVPQSSLIGMLLEHSEHYTVVRSNQIGILQHDLYSWQTDRNGLQTLESLTQTGQEIDRTLTEWLAGISLEQRRLFIDTLYEILSATKATTVKELGTKLLGKVPAVLRHDAKLPPATKQKLLQTLRLLAEMAGKFVPLLPGL